MHPVLRMHNLDQAPPFCRETLLDAVRADGARALENLRFLSKGLGTRILPKHILPVLYANLDSDLVVGMRSSDSVSPFPDYLIERVSISMAMLTVLIQKNRVPSGAYPFIWPRLFDWVSYVDNYYDVHLELQAQRRRQFSCTFVLAAFELLKDDATRTLVEGTPGFRTLLGRIWFSFPESFEEPGIPHLNPVALIDFLGPPLEIVCKTRENHDFTATLLDNGLAPALTRVIAMHAAREHHGGPFLDDFLSAFSRGALATQPFRWVAEGLRAGLLEALVMAATNYPHRPDTVEYLRWFFSVFLPQAMVYLPVVSALADHWVDCLSLSKEHAFQASAVFPEWKDFVSLASDRMFSEAYHVSHPDRSRSTQMCSNEECGALLSPKSMRRCLACRICYYCSDACQRLHWLNGEHRAECEDLRLHRIGKSTCPSQAYSLITRSLSRSRALVRPQSLILVYPRSTGRHPDEQICITFDFKDGKCQSQILSATPFLSHPYPEKFSAQLRHHLARAARTDGQMQVAAVKVEEGSINVFRIVLIWHADLTVRDTLVELARTLPFGVARENAGLASPILLPLFEGPLPTFVYASA
ncbi:hypothetical protein FB45DRAFT_1063497 [Roridomyces roridus]|uniref:MYND-type domain-containing protein n=1 Tax=Roridomyces roridus TaxID=1738132 RepID=A0AAD7BE19_9AGAR|nr:hypothetical protein FB45DRAFT_1063497 [Roridomyces roridus]